MGNADRQWSQFILANYDLFIGDEIQKISVIKSLPELLKEDQAVCMNQIVPKVLQSLKSGNSSTEYHSLVSKVVITILKERLIPIESFVTTFLPQIICLLDNRDLLVINAWCETLVESVKILPLDVLKRVVVPVAVTRSQMGRTVSVRLSSCALLGEMATRFDIASLKKELLPTIISLCQDVDGEVRASICLQLQKVIPALKNEPNKTTLLSSLIELGSDEMQKVKEAAFITTVEILDSMGIDVLRTTLLTLIKQFINHAFKNDESFLPTITLYFGKMCLGLDKAIGGDKELFVKYFMVLSSLGTTYSSKKLDKNAGSMENLLLLNVSNLVPEKYLVCRRNCAQNFPAMCKFCYDDTSPVYLEILKPALKELVSDPYFMVRKIMAGGIGQICINLGKYNHLMKHEFVHLMNDQGEEVLEAFIPNISTVIECFIKTGVYKNEHQTRENVLEVANAFINCESLISTSHNWRLYSSFIEQLAVIHKIVSSDTLYANFVGLLFKKIHATRVVPIRMAVAKTILIFLRYIQKSQHRTDIRARIINEFCHSSTFYNRMFFIRTCRLIMEIFSTNYFKEHFFFRTLQLVDDPVPNIRWAMLMMMPQLRHMLKPQVEKKMVQLVDTAMSKLYEDKDREIIAQFAAIKIVCDSPDQKYYNQFFPNDGKKLEEEKKLALLDPKGGDKPAVQIPSNLPRGPVSPPRVRGGSGSRQSLVPGAHSPQNQPNKRTPIPTPSTSPRPSVNRQSGFKDSLEFIVDTGVQLESLPRTHEKKTSRSIPVLRSVKNDLKNNNLKKTQTEKRRSLDVMNLNTGNENENHFKSNIRRHSLLPRPLSCVNFPVKNASEKSTKLPIRKLET